MIYEYNRFDVEQWFTEKIDDNPVSILGQREDDIGKFKAPTGLSKKFALTEILHVCSAWSVILRVWK